MEELSALKIYLNNISKFRILTKEEEKALFEKAKNGDSKAREEIINCNLRLVVAIAKKYQAQHLQLMDLIQEGNLGLIEAYNKYDVSMGYKFSTYATWWIKQNIGNAISNKNDMIRKPVYLKESIAKMKKVARQIEMQSGNSASVEEIANAMKISKKTVENMQKVINNSQVISIETPLNNETNDTLQDFIADDESETQEEIVSKKDSTRFILNIIDKTLTPREKDVILMRMGFVSGEEETLQAIGDKLKLTRERVRQLESQALKKLARVKELKDLA